MFTVQLTERFSCWLDAVRDVRARVALARRLDRARAGNLGDVKPVGGGVSEMRVDVGPGYRMYFTQRDGRLVVLLVGGDKSTQAADIKRAKAIAKEL